MKKILIVVLLTLIFQTGYSHDLQKIRKDYIESIKDEKSAIKLYDQLKSIKNPDPLIQAYLGSAQAVRAKHAWNPVNKLNFLKQGCNTLDLAVKRSPNQLEIRFLRFSLQHFLPPFLGYSTHLETDKDKILELIQKREVTRLQVDKEILKNMVNFMIDSKRCNAKEIVILRNVLA